ncbi:MAG: hypothetical protein LBC68_12795 [Prevotellaceae bacterium]|jgi:hypothetical protein|nr:hypothetical protein [Prevotellaceae bacterium]
MIITPAIFEGEITVGQVEFDGKAAQVQWFIDKYEPLYLAKLLGKSLANELLTEYAKEIHDEKWNILADKVKMAIAYYVYYYFQKNDATVSVGAGEETPQTENGTRATNVYKTVWAWNEMVQFSIDFPFWIDKHIYPDYAVRLSDINCFKNTFGL